MPLPSNLTTLVSNLSPLAGEAVRRFSDKPALRSVAHDLAAQALARLHPNVSLDPDNIALGWPPEVSPTGKIEHLALPDLLVDVYARGGVLTIIDGYQFALRREGDQWVPMELNLQALAEELDAVRPSLGDAFAQALAQFWSVADVHGKTHWTWMADYLRRAFVQGLEAARIAKRVTAGDYFAAMRVATRARGGEEISTPSGVSILATLVHLEQKGETTPFDARLDPHLLLKLKDEEGERFIAFSPNGGLRWFASTQALLDDFSHRPDNDPLFNTAKVQRIRIDGDIFTALARVLLQTQLLQVERFTQSVMGFPNQLGGDLVNVASEALTGFFWLDAAIQRGTNRWLQLRLPEWLRRAATNDRWQFADKLARVALTKPLTGHSWFLDGIPTIQEFALKRLSEEARHLHPKGLPLEPANIEATHVYVVQDLIAVTGGPWEPTFREDAVDVTELAINNLSSQSLGWLKVRPKQGTQLPAWLDGEALKGLIRTIDVGKTYPQLLRKHLLEGEGANERQALFSTQVVMQLPLLALELVLKGEAGMDRDGYALVQGGIGALPVEDTTRLMTLGVTAGEGYGTDPIAAHYVFIRENSWTGCCVLYRPLHPDQLRQYSSMDALWEDLAAPGNLQDEALRWMTDLGRARYGHGGWRQPRVTRFGQGDEFAPLYAPSPARPVLTPLAAPTVDTLYHQVVEAIIHMAERRSISNAEDRWVSLGTLAWTLFNGVLPLFNGPLSAAGWLIQLSEQFAEFLKAKDVSEAASQAARNNLLFSLVLLLVSEGLHWPIDEPQDIVHEGDDEATIQTTVPTGEDGRPGPGGSGSVSVSFPTPGTPVSLTLSDEILTEAQALVRPRALDLRWSSSELILDARQQAALEALRAEHPGTPSLIPHGPTQGLYLLDNRLLVKWQEHFYAVNLEEDAPRIVGPNDEFGPYLRRDETGHWTLDLRLRLRGGGPKRSVAARRQENEKIRAQAEQLFAEAMPAFDALRDRVNEVSTELERIALLEQPLSEGRKQLDAILSEGYKACAELVDRYEALHQTTPLPKFADRQCALLARLLNVSKAMVENAAELNREYIDASPLLHANAEEFEKTTSANPVAWQAFLDRLEVSVERTIAGTIAHHQTVKRLTIFPGIGERTLEANAESAALTVTLPGLWSSLAYCRLSQVLEPLRNAPVVANDIYTALDPVLVHSASHAEAAFDPSLNAEQAMRVFDTAVLNYQRGEDITRALRETLAPEYRSDALERFEEVTASLRQDAERRMGELIRAQTSEAVGPSRAPRRQVAKAKPRPTKPKAKPGDAAATTSQGASGADSAPDNLQLIQTADGEAIMAHIRSSGTEAGKIAEVISNGRVLATWSRDSLSGAWRKVESPSVTPSVQTHARLNTLIRQADQSLAGVRQDLKRINRLKQATSIPADIEDLYHGRAQRLEELADQIEQALTRLNATDAATEEHGSAQVKALQLRSQATEARNAGTAARIELSKAMMPTAARVEFLLQAGEVSIRRLGGRVQLKREGRRDFVQEYEIADRENHPLWYAHFHYDTSTAAADAYTAAHLKTVTQRFDGYQRQLEQARNDQEVVSIYRSRIAPELARRLFLSLP